MASSWKRGPGWPCKLAPVNISCPCKSTFLALRHFLTPTNGSSLLPLHHSFSTSSFSFSTSSFSFSTSRPYIQKSQRRNAEWGLWCSGYGNVCICVKVWAKVYTIIKARLLSRSSNKFSTSKQGLRTKQFFWWHIPGSLLKYWQSVTEATMLGL